MSLDFEDDQYLARLSYNIISCFVIRYLHRRGAGTRYLQNENSYVNTKARTKWQTMRFPEYFPLLFPTFSLPLFHSVIQLNCEGMSVAAVDISIRELIMVNCSNLESFVVCVGGIVYV